MPLNDSFQRALGQTYESTAEARSLLAAGADPNTRCPNGYSALARAAQADDPVFVTELLASGADPDGTDADGETALMCAVDFADPRFRPRGLDVIDALAAGGSDLEATDPRWGQTPLLRAIVQGNHRVVARLLALGASVDAVDREGHDGRTLARQGQSHQVRELLGLDSSVDPQVEAVESELLQRLKSGRYKHVDHVAGFKQEYDNEFEIVYEDGVWVASELDGYSNAIRHFRPFEDTDRQLLDNLRDRNTGGRAGPLDGLRAALARLEERSGGDLRLRDSMDAGSEEA